MIRQMTSNVSALSGFVANGQQAIRFVATTLLHAFRATGFPQHGWERSLLLDGLPSVDV